MCYGICKLTVIPIRAEASHKSEMVSQLLYGECYKVDNTLDGWLKITTVNDDYSGWIQQAQHFSVDSKEFSSYCSRSKRKVCRPIVSASGTKVLLTIGATADEDVSDDGVSQFLLDEYNVGRFPLEKKIDILKNAALSLLDAPYLWGGRTPLGIDCSGFVQLLYSLIGVSLPRDASQQVASGKTVDFINETKIGDLAFFQNEDGNITHVGMIIDNNRIIHASGRVRIDNIDETGIFNTEIGKYSHFLRIIKRIL